jgi:hypothetical protein
MNAFRLYPAAQQQRAAVHTVRLLPEGLFHLVHASSIVVTKAQHMLQPLPVMLLQPLPKDPLLLLLLLLLLPLLILHGCSSWWQMPAPQSPAVVRALAAILSALSKDSSDTQATSQLQGAKQRSRRGNESTCSSYEGAWCFESLLNGSSASKQRTFMDKL